MIQYCFVAILPEFFNEQITAGTSPVKPEPGLVFQMIILVTVTCLEKNRCRHYPGGHGFLKDVRLVDPMNSGLCQFFLGMGMVKYSRAVLGTSVHKGAAIVCWVNLVKKIGEQRAIGDGIRVEPYLNG
jgi:hypothetical protein